MKITIDRSVVEQALEALEKLWQIIDDIDTYGDMAKADDKLYRSLVERKQRTRFEETGISTDGYTLNGGAITALRAALAQPVQEPYCYIYEYDGAFGLHREFYPGTYNGKKPSRTVPLYTAPPQPAQPVQDTDCHAQGICQRSGYSIK